MANRRRRLAPYLFISPFFIGYAIFFLYPVLWALYLSFFQQVGIGSEPKFVGLQNYANLLSDDTFRTALVNTSYYAAGSIFLIVPLALLLAVVLFMRSLRGREFFRLFFYRGRILKWVINMRSRLFKYTGPGFSKEKPGIILRWKNSSACGNGKTS